PPGAPQRHPFGLVNSYADEWILGTSSSTKTHRETVSVRRMSSGCSPSIDPPRLDPSGGEVHLRARYSNLSSPDHHDRLEHGQGQSEGSRIGHRNRSDASGQLPTCAQKNQAH